jgi:hypothetical protein
MMQKTSTQTNPLFPGFTELMFIAMLLSALASGGQMLSFDSDLGRHLTLGHYILDHRIIPTRDLLSQTLLNAPRPPYEWLSQVLFALADRLLGLDGVILLTANLIAITFALTFLFANRRSKLPFFAFIITLLVAGASSLHWLPRPHIITFLLLTIWIEKLEQVRRQSPIRLYIFPLIMLLWANSHGGFIFGMLAWLAYIAGWLWEKWHGKANDRVGMALLTIGLTSLVASVITPDLWHNWEAVLGNRSAFILSRTVETMPPDLADPAVLPFTFLLTLTIVLLLLNRKIVSASHFFLLAGLGYMSLLMARNIPLFAIVCAPILAELGSASLKRLKKWDNIETRFGAFGKQSLWTLIPLIVLLWAVGYFANRNFSQAQAVFQFNPQVFPVHALNWLENNPQTGNMFNEFNWGGYILYRSWPQQRVFLDSQSDFYGEPLIREYNQVVTLGTGWEEILNKYNVNWVIMPREAPLVTALSAGGDWEIPYQDSTATILVHK